VDRSNFTNFRSLIYKNYIGEIHYKSWLDFSQHASIPRHHPLCAMSPSTIRHSSSTKSHIYVFNRFFVAYSMYITPRVYNRILPCNIFGVTTFIFHLKILFKKFSQQRAGYHLVFTKKENQNVWTTL
jgi:hypothetical protein